MHACMCMFMHMHVCICSCTRICMHSYVYACMYAWEGVCTHLNINVRTHIGLCVYAYLGVYIYVRQRESRFVCDSVCGHVHMVVYKQKCIHHQHRNVHAYVTNHKWLGSHHIIVRILCMHACLYTSPDVLGMYSDACVPCLGHQNRDISQYTKSMVHEHTGICVNRPDCACVPICVSFRTKTCIYSCMCAFVSVCVCLCVRERSFTLVCSLPFTCN